MMSEQDQKVAEEAAAREAGWLDGPASAPGVEDPFFADPGDAGWDVGSAPIAEAVPSPSAAPDPGRDEAVYQAAAQLGVNHEHAASLLNETPELGEKMVELGLLVPNPQSDRDLLAKT